MTRYADLIAKLEQCQVPDRHLDSLIWAEVDDRDVITHTDGQLMARSRRAPYDTCLLDPERHKPPLPKFTQSLDAALTLVPEGCDWELNWTAKRTYAEARIFKYNDRGQVLGQPYSGWCDATTPAIALCISALKARAAEESDT